MKGRIGQKRRTTRPVDHQPASLLPKDPPGGRVPDLQCIKDHLRSLRLRHDFRYTKDRLVRGLGIPNARARQKS